MELREYVMPLRRWWWLILVATLVAAVSSYFATRPQPYVYRSRTTLLLGTAAEDPNPTGNDVWLAQQLMSTYTELAQRDTVRNATMESLGLSKLPEYTLQMIPNTQLIEISVVDTDPHRAQAVANQLAEQLIRLTPNTPDGALQQRQSFVNQQLDELEVKIKETQEEIVKKQSELAELFSARRIDDAQNELNALQTKLTSLQANYASLLTNTQRGAINTMRVVEVAPLPTIPIGPNKLLTILLAAFIGFVLAVAAAYLMEYLDDTLKSPEDAQRHLELATLGMVPEIERQSIENGLITLTEGRGMAAESFRVLSTNLRFIALDSPIRSLVVTSAAPIEGKSLTASNLAIAMAQAGRRVILVDADLRKPNLHRLFKVPNNVGVTSMLLEDHSDPKLFLQPTEIPSLSLITSGRLPPNPTDLLGSNRMRDLLNKLLDQCDLLVLDAPPILGMADAPVVAAQVDGSLLVLDFGRTRSGTAQQAVNALKQVGARVVGVVLNRIPPRQNGHYYYYYYSDDGNGSQTKRKSTSPNARAIGQHERRGKA